MDEHKKTNEPNDSELFDKVVNENDEPTTSAPEQSAAPVAAAPAIQGQPVPPVQPVVAQESTQPVPPSAVKPADEHNKGGVIVLQWLSYAFWGWFASAFTILAGFVITSILDSSDEVDIAAYVYPLSAVLVTYVFAIVADFFYRKYEPVQKTGAANVIMLIHAVIYILITAGAMIGFVFALISWVLSLAAAGTNGSLSAVLIATVALVVFGSVAVRVVLGAKKPAVRKGIWLGLSILTAIIMLAAIGGPIAKSIALKEDRLIERNLNSVQTLIDDYVDENSKLPASLKELKVTSSYNGDEVQQLIDRNIVEYKPGAGGAASSSKSSDDFYTTSYKTELKYQLCVDYKAEKEGGRYSSYSSQGNYVSTSTHPKGNVCYDLYATKYSYNR